MDSPPIDNHSSERRICPENCATFNDGCNSCKCDLETREIGACTKKMCFYVGTKSCEKYAEHGDSSDAEDSDAEDSDAEDSDTQERGVLQRGGSLVSGGQGSSDEQFFP